MNLLIDLTLRTSALLLVGLALSALLNRRSAALRHGVIATTLLAAAIVVPLRVVLPTWDVRLPLGSLSIAATRATPGSDAAGDATREPHAAVPGAEASASGAAAATAGDATRTGNAGTGERAGIRGFRLASGIASSVASALAAGIGAATSGRIVGVAVAPLVLIVWALGCVAGLATLLAGIGRLVRVGARAQQVRDGRWARVAAQVADAYGMPARTVTLLQTDVIDLLATWGLRRPRVLLPAHARGWSPDRVRVVLGHELAHIRRGDWAIQMGAEILRTIYWFNPLLWIACARLRRESEQACDDAVLRMGVQADEYAEHLLEVARSCRGWGTTPAAVMPLARPSTLERRITAMLNPDLDRRALSARPLVLAAALLLGIALPMAALRAAQATPRALEGAVFDTTGGLMREVALTLTDSQASQSPKREARTDKDGRFRFDAVPPGRYVLEASVAGFRPLREEIDLRQAADWDRAVTLQVGTLRETITVSTPRVAGPRPGTPSASSGPTRTRIGGAIQPPSKSAHVAPVYPPAMRDAGREGVVPLEAIVGRDGVVTSVRVLSAQIHPDFAIAAADAVRQWRYVPTLLNGEPIEVVITVTVTFALSDAAAAPPR